MTERMLWDVVTRAAALASKGDTSVDEALRSYARIEDPQGSRDAQVWVSVAFLCARHEKVQARLIR